MKKYILLILLAIGQLVVSAQEAKRIVNKADW